MAIESVNPVTGERIRRYEPHSGEDVDRILDAVRDAWRGWRTLDFEERARPMRALAARLRERADELARLMALEMGKPLDQGRSEADKCAWVAEHYAEHAASYLADEDVATEARRSFVTYPPLGPVLAVMPWNFPLWQVLRFAAPNLMAGNAAVLKHASNVPGCALALEELFREAGFPRDLFRTLLVESDALDPVIADDRIAAVTLTGSVRAGRAVARRAGEALKKTVLELGGSDPYVVLEDADLDAAVEACVSSRLINSGQSCIAAKRFVVVEAVARDFEERFVDAMRAKRMGDPLGDEAIDLGPQARRDLRDELHAQVERSVEAGARCLAGGEVPAGRGAFYPPTVLTGVRRGMPAWDEETFGPVAAIISVPDEDAAIEAANASLFGLGAAVFTRDLERGERIAARRLSAGCTFVNAFVKSDPRLPFGGVRESGYGRELGLHGIRELVNVKTVWVD